jgi:hypothetical protein
MTEAFHSKCSSVCQNIYFAVNDTDALSLKLFKVMIRLIHNCVSLQNADMQRVANLLKDLLSLGWSSGELTLFVADFLSKVMSRT